MNRQSGVNFLLPNDIMPPRIADFGMTYSFLRSAVLISALGFNGPLTTFESNSVPVALD